MRERAPSPRAMSMAIAVPFVLLVGALLSGCGRSPAPMTPDGGQDGPTADAGSGSADVSPGGADGGEVQVDSGTSVDPDAGVDPPPPPPPPPPPKKPDLVVKTFDAKLVDGDIHYAAEVCNEGQDAALLFRADYYYNNPTAPLPLIAGDESAFVPVLDGGKCISQQHVYQSAPVGIYAARFRVDTLGTVAEANEDNNDAGPRLVFVSSSAGCAAFCGFASTCGLFGWTEYTRCLDWCASMDQTAQGCAFDAAKQLSCAELQACSLPPLPPAQPPPLSCFNICNYLINDCKLLPAEQLLTCIGGCVGLAATKKQCAYEAMQNNKCMQLMLCLF